MPKDKPQVSESPAGDESKAPRKKYADDDNSIDARMWRLNQDHIRMGSRVPEKP